MSKTYSYRIVKTPRKNPFRCYVVEHSFTPAASIGGKPTPKRKNVLSQSFDTKAKAEDWGADRVYELKNGKSAHATLARGAGKTLNDLGTYYLSFAGDHDVEKDKYSGGLYEADQHKAYIAWWMDKLGSLSLAEIDQQRIKDELRTYLSEPCMHYCRKQKKAVPNARKRTAASRNRLHAALRRMYKFAQQESWVSADLLSPAHQVKMPKEGNERKRGLSQAQVKELLEACKDSHWDRMHLYISGLVITGARKNEWLGMEWKRINLTTQRAFVPNTKNGEAKFLKLAGGVLDELLDVRRAEYLKHLEREGRGWAVTENTEVPAEFMPEGLVFPSPMKPKQPICIRKAWTNAKAAIGMTGKIGEAEELDADGQPIIRYLRLHDLRHTAGFLLREQGADQFAIRDHLGHKKLQSTERYVGKSQSGIDKTTDKLAALVNG